MKHRPTSTARGVALVRAVEMLRPARERVACDPHARAFVNPLNVYGLRLLQMIGLLRLIGVEPMLTFAIVRERYVEDLVAAEMRAGVAQIVILGAGFDTRAYRIEAPGGLPVFEVDHPVTQEQKRTALDRAAIPAHVSFVTVDFETDDLGERLLAAGYREDLRTLFVWQGVSVYLTEAAIDGTLAFIAQHSAKGSAVVFDYFEARALRAGEAKVIRLFTTIMGEQVRFAIDQREIDAFLTARGLTDVRNADAAQMSSPYLTGPNASRPMPRGVNIVAATVA